MSTYYQLEAERLAKEYFDENHDKTHPSAGDISEAFIAGFEAGMKYAPPKESLKVGYDTIEEKLGLR